MNAKLKPETMFTFTDGSTITYHSKDHSWSTMDPTKVATLDSDGTLHRDFSPGTRDADIVLGIISDGWSRCYQRGRDKNADR